MVGLLKKDNKTIESIDENKVSKIIDFIKILQSGKINAKQGKTIIAEIYSTDLDAKSIIEKHGFKQITDPREIENLLVPIVEKNLAVIQKNKDRPERYEKMIIGLLMKETKGQANPVISADVLKKVITEKIK
ncbi:MAG: hypothetical protein MJ223_01740 [Mycoplasmoidaceae bacterium]|nr:hypothetical protein [Mycoplasmoidaceae bacterium]